MLGVNRIFLVLGEKRSEIPWKYLQKMRGKKNGGDTESSVQLLAPNAPRTRPTSTLNSGRRCKPIFGLQLTFTWGLLNRKFLSNNPPYIDKGGC
jgi:hypothetical protein